MASLRQQLEALIGELAPNMERAFREAIDDIKSEIVLKEVVERLERQDIEGAIAALHIDPAAFRPLSEAIREAFNAGGLLVTRNMPRLSDPAGGRVVVRWDVSNQRAEQIIRDQSSQLITRVTEDTKQLAREAIHSGYAQGQGPRTIALDLAGRLNRVTQRREGGLIGLTSPLARTVENARAALLSGDVEGMKHYLTLTRRDKRFDRQVAKAIREGKPLPADAVAKITGRLADGYVQFRGQMIARTETQSSVHAAKHEAYQQGLDRSGRDAALVTRRWRSVGDGRVRHTHQVLNAQEVTGMDLPFQSPSGALMRFPGDTSLGAGPGEIIACRCHVEYNFDFAEEYARSRGR
ncbi:phage minor head protein [Ensifer sp. OV372]|uniref:phage minor head protein n=1 Tax=Ensifer sp. OV372 TaxID=1855293 RepID=UPI0008F3E59D|nr:phage minor head protein [Ensifer sp. OV372]SFH29512.1 Phage Mu protein F like protein [Ensifer sp. OV372]